MNASLNQCITESTKITWKMPTLSYFLVTQILKGITLFSKFTVPHRRKCLFTIILIVISSDSSVFLNKSLHLILFEMEQVSYIYG